VHLEMGLLRLVNAARLAPLEELLSEMKGGGTGGSSAPLTGGRTGSFSSPVPRSAGASLSSAPSAAPFAAPRPAAPAPSASVPHPSASSSIAAQPPRFSADATHSDNAGASILHSASSGVAEPASQHPDPAPQNTSGAAHGAEVSSSAPDQPAAVAAEALGIAPAQIAEIKCAIQSEKKFLGELVEHAHRWELAGAELRLHFPADRRSFAELVEGRETLEKIRAASSKVLGRSVRVCAKIDSVATAAASASRGGSGSQELRARFERDPMIRSMLQRFGGKITEVRRQGES
jgi:hypothetical protein